MYSRGEYRDKDGTYGVIMSHTKQSTEIILVTSGQVSSYFGGIYMQSLWQVPGILFDNLGIVPA